jgi:hypothetical protein
MKPKAIASIALLLFVGVSAVYLTMQELDSGEPDASAISSTIDAGESAITDESAKPHQIEVVYFHSTQRCQTCLWIESHAQGAVVANFETELDDSLLVWRSVDFEQPEHKHYAKEFGLYTQSLILIEHIDGQQSRATNLELIWELVREDSAFADYVQTEVRTFLDGA